MHLVRLPVGGEEPKKRLGTVPLQLFSERKVDVCQNRPKKIGKEERVKVDHQFLGLFVIFVAMNDISNASDDPSFLPLPTLLCPIVSRQFKPDQLEVPQSSLNPLKRLLGIARAPIEEVYDLPHVRL